MESLITFNNDEQQTVSARQLHEALEIKTRFDMWFPRICEYGFTEPQDFNLHKFEQVQIEGSREVKREVTDYNLSMDMAKQICMLQRTEKGQQGLQYNLKRYFTRRRNEY